MSGVGAAFASFKLDGKLNYVDMYGSGQQGQQGIGTVPFYAENFKNNPIQYEELSGKNGFNSITGVVDSASGIKKVIITFSKGQVQEVPVVKDKFWFFGRAGSTEKNVYSREVIGVTANGSIVVKKN
jgi:hypothetical protein